MTDDQPLSAEELDRRIGGLLSSDTYCAYCQRWIPPTPAVGWTVLVGLDSVEIVHADCLEADHSNWELVNRR